MRLILICLTFGIIITLSKAQDTLKYIENRDMNEDILRLDDSLFSVKKVFLSSSPVIWVNENEIEINLNVSNQLDEDIYVILDEIEFLFLEEHELENNLPELQCFTNKVIIYLLDRNKEFENKLNYNCTILESNKFPTYYLAKPVDYRLETIKNKNKPMTYNQRKTINISLRNSDFIDSTFTHDVLKLKVIANYFLKEDLPKIEKELGFSINAGKIQSKNKRENFKFDIDSTYQIFDLYKSNIDKKIGKQKLERVFNKYIKQVEIDYIVSVFKSKNP